MKLFFAAASCLVSMVVAAQQVKLTIPVGHRSSPRAIALSSDQKLLASADDEFIIIWDAVGGKEIRQIRTKGTPESLSWNKDNQTLAVLTSRDSLVLFDAAKGALIKQPIEIDGAYRMRYSADGKYILVSLGGNMKVFDANSLELIQTIEVPKKAPQLMIISTPDETLWAGMDMFKNIITLNQFSPGTGGSNIDANTIAKIKLPLEAVRRIKFSPDGKYLLALCGPDFGMVCFDIPSGNVKWKTTSAESFDDLGFTNDGKTIIVLHEGVIENYSLTNGEKTGAAMQLEKGYGTDLIVLGGKPYLWDMWHEEYRITRYNSITGQKDKTFAGDFEEGLNAQVASNAPIFIQNGNKSPLHIWNLKDCKVQQSIQMEKPADAFAVSANGETVVYGKPLTAFDTKTGKEKFSIYYDYFYRPDKIVISTCEKWIATINDGEPAVALFNTQEKQQVWRNKLPSEVSSLSFSDNENYLATLSKAGEVKIFAVPAGNEVTSFIVDGAVNLAFTKNNMIAVTASNGMISLYNAQTGSKSASFNALPANVNITTLNISSDRNLLLLVNKAAGNDIYVVDLEHQKIVSSLYGHYGTHFAGFLPDAKHIISTGYDNSTKLWDVSTGKELAQLYAYNKQWVAVTSDGRFDGTAEAISKLYYTKGTDILPLQTLYENYYTPGLLPQLLNYGSLPTPDVVIDVLKNAPVVKINYKPEIRNLVVDDDLLTFNETKQVVSLTVEANSKDDMIAEIRLFQNGKLVNSTRNLVVDDAGSAHETKTFTVNLTDGSNELKAIALNSQRTESRPDIIVLNYKAPANNEENNITLHLMVVGINTYKNPKYTLNYAKADASSFKEAMELNSNNIFAQKKVYYITDADAMKANIEAAFNKVVAAAKPQDVFVFYFAGHGVMTVDKTKEFYIVPYDVTQLYGADDALAQKGISAAELREFAKNIAAQKQLYILDACQSAAALDAVAMRGVAEEKAVAQLARSTGSHWLTASGSEQYASEVDQLGHGVFTYVLLKGLQGAADNGDKRITVNELKAYLEAQVPELTQKYKGSPQYPASYGFGNDFPLEVLK